MRALLLGLVWLPLTVVSSAQGSEFYPLNEGDSWTYEVFDNASFSLYSTPVGRRLVEARTDTTIEGASHRLMDVTYTDYEQTVTETARCAVRVTEDTGRIVWISLRGVCGALEADLTAQSTQSASETYYVGGISYEGPVRSTPGRRIEMASGLGLVTADVQSVTAPRRRQNRLIRATVAGVEYGIAPDPTAWRAFYPLAAGNRRAFRINSSGTVRHLSDEVTGQETIGDATYMRISQTIYNNATPPAMTGTATLLERYRDDLGCAVLREANGSETCRTSRLGGMISFIRTTTVDVSGQTVAARAITDGGSSGNASAQTRYAEGLGLILDRFSSGSATGGFSETELLYALVDGVGTGVEPAWVMWPVAGESDPDPADALSLRLASANPTAGTVRLRASVAEARTVWLTVTDVLGRVIEARDLTLAAGTTEVSIALDGYAAGLYRVQMRDSAGASAAVSVTRR